MQDSRKKQNSHYLRPTSRRRNDFHEEIFVDNSDTDEESLVFKKTVRRKRKERKGDVKLNLNLHVPNNLEEKESELDSPIGNESFNDNNDLNSNIYSVSTQETSNCTIIDSQGSLDQLKLANWGLPRRILKKYESRGIKTMFPWQVECLSNERIIMENRNLIYSAPTSAGKTLVAEILLLKTVLERKKKAIFILPFVSVVREKMFYFKDLLNDSGIRVEGFMGSIVPAGGFHSVQIAIATIEKANSLINHLLEEDELSSVGAVVIDELHLLGDPNRGYILELLLTKLRYITLRYEDISIQLIGMSATLPNLSMLASWLDAELYKTDFRPIPLNEQCKIDSMIYDRDLQIIRELPVVPEIRNDIENIIQLCIETIEGGHSILIFCPTKNWCEKLAEQTATSFLTIGRSNSHLGQVLQNGLDASAIFETLEQLKRTPTGLDSVLRNTVSFGVAFHHAGLTIDERDIIEGSFRTGSLKVLVATSTLSTGVNLPARRVIIRSPCFHGKPLDTLSYRQMIGRAGRMGKDTAGESILICKSNEKAVAETLLTASLKPIESCLEDSGPLMRSLLEAIASNIVRTPEDLDCYVKCTFINLQEEGEGSISNAVKESVEFLVTNEFLILQETEEEHLKRWSATPLGKACLSASVPPKEGLFLFEELLKARKCIALDTELHVVYLVTPYNSGSQIGQIDWMNYFEMWSIMPEPEKRVAKLVGVEERFLLNAVRGAVPPGKNLNIHKRFYTALALYELVREIPLHKVCKKFGCGRGLLQSLQQSSSTYAGMITSFCKQLNWSCMELLVAQFQTRLQFGVSRDLMDLLRLPSLNGLRARSLYKEGITSIVELAVANELEVERALHKALPFESEKGLNGEKQFEIARQNKVRTTFITGKDGLTTREAAVLLIREARTLLQNELGVRDVQWDRQTEEPSKSLQNNSNIADNLQIESKNESKTADNNVEENLEQAQNLSNEKSGTLERDNSSRNKVELTIERKFSQKSQKNDDLQESSNLDPLILESSSFSHKSVYENINKEVESALEKVLIRDDAEEEKNDIEDLESQFLFDSSSFKNELEQNVVDSLRYSDFDSTANISKKRESPCSQLNSENYGKKSRISDDNFSQQGKSGSKSFNQNVDETFFGGSEFSSNFGEKQIQPMNENIQDTSELHNSDLKLTDNKHDSPISLNENIENKNTPEISLIFDSNMTVENPKELNKNETKEISKVEEFSEFHNSDFELTDEKHDSQILRNENENISNYFADDMTLKGKDPKELKENEVSNNKERNISKVEEFPKLHNSDFESTVEKHDSQILKNENETISKYFAHDMTLENPKELRENEVSNNEINISKVEEFSELHNSDFELTDEKHDSQILKNENENISKYVAHDMTLKNPEELKENEVSNNEINISKVEEIGEILSRSDMFRTPEIEEHEKDVSKEISNENKIINIPKADESADTLTQGDIFEIEEQENNPEEELKNEFNEFSNKNESILEILQENEQESESNENENALNETLFLGSSASDLNISPPHKKSPDSALKSTQEILEGINLSDFLTDISSNQSKTKISKHNLSKIDESNESNKENQNETIIENQNETLKENQNETNVENQNETNKENQNETNKEKNKTSKKIIKIGSGEILTKMGSQNQLKIVKENPKKSHKEIKENSNLSRIKSNMSANNLETRGKEKVSQESLTKVDNISHWVQDSWDKIELSIKEDKKKNETGTLPKKKILPKDSKKMSKSVIGKRKFSVGEGSPIASIETFEKRRTPVSDKTLAKKMKLSGIEPKNLANTDFSKAGPSKIEKENLRKSSIEKLIGESFESQSSCDSLVFTDDESLVDKWKPANIISSKKMLTLLKQKLIKKINIAFALHCETITEDRKIVIGAKIIRDEKNEKKKLKDEKFVYENKKICGFTISWGFQALYYIPLSVEPGIRVSLKERLNFLIELLTNSSLNVRCFSSRKIYKLLYHCCGIISSCKFIDPIVADWMLNTEGKGKDMNYLVSKYYPIAYDYYESRNVIENNSQYIENESTKEAVLIWHIAEVLLKKIEKSATLSNTFKDVEMEVLSVLSRMELRGLGINLPALKELSDVIKREMSLLEQKAFNLAGKNFNFMSSSNVAQVLGLHRGKRVSTSKAVLEQSDHPIAKLIISWRKLSTLQSLVVIPLMSEAHNSRIYGSHITHTVTGRVSMHEPNLQNIPKDFNSEDNSFVISIRMAFIATVGNIMLSADYCQLELRILAHFSNDSVLRSIMKKEGVDIFRSISAMWNNIDEDMVDDKIRQRTKQLCYGMIYGMGTKSLAESLSVTEEEAKEFLETFMRTYKGIRSWLSNVVARARVNGYVTTITKRCRLLPGIRSDNRSEKSQAERQAINTKIQGSAADIAKKAMVSIDKKLQEEFFTSPVIFPAYRPKRRLRSSGSNSEFRGAYLVLQLHDELLFEVNANDLHHVARLVKESMENAYPLSVPLPVKLKIGPAWGDLKEYNF